MGFVFNVHPDGHETSVRYLLHDAIVFIAAFIEQQNGQVQRFCDGFDVASRTDCGFIYNKERGELCVSGVSEFEYDLNGVFKEEFPEYILESQVIMLWSVLEKNLMSVAQGLFKIKDKPWRGIDKRKSCFLQLIKRIEEAIGIKFPSATVSFLNSNARAVRNALIHSKRSIHVTHEFLDVKEGILVSVHPEYVSEVVLQMKRLSVELLVT